MKHKGCGGACCRRFVLQYSPEELRVEGGVSDDVVL